MKCAIYTRLSTTDQNCEHQIHELQQYANRRGCAIVETYRDVMSGAKVNRPDLNRLMLDAFPANSGTLTDYPISFVAALAN